jgi:multidrug efflux pump subunit AcrB
MAEHPVAANLAMLVCILAGLWALRAIPTQLDPPQNIPVVVVEVEWRSAAAEDIEELVTTPIEQQLRTVNALRELRSETTIGYTRIVAEFEFDADMVLALDTVKQRVDNIRNLPPEIEPPIVRRIIDLEPVAAVLVSSPGSIDEIVPLVRAYERDLLARGVAAIQYDGLPAEEIALLIGSRELDALGLTLDDIAAAVARTSKNVPAGTIGRGQGARQLRSLDQARDPLAFEQVVFEHGDALVRIGDIGDVVRRPRDGEPIVSHDGRPAVQMTLMRETHADASRADDVFDAWLEEARSTAPAGVALDVYSDVWELLGAQLRMVGNNALSSIVLVGLTLLAFLNGRVSFWVMAGVPVSILLALVFFDGLFHYGISIIALLGFIMAFGIIVDDSIVVGEDALTLFESGRDPRAAAVEAAERMWTPVLASSLTTLAAFLPLMLIGGIMGAVILALPTALFCVILASLIECFLVLPGHLRASFEKLAKAPRRSRLRQRFDDAFRRFRDARFAPLLRLTLAYPGATLMAAIGSVVCAVSLVASQHVGVNFVTGFDVESVAANVEFAASATDADKAAFARHLEATLSATAAETGEQNLTGWMTRQNLATFSQERKTGIQFLSIEAPFALEEARTVTPAAFVEAWRNRIERPPVVEQITVAVEGGANNGQADITLVLRGNDIESLKAGADEVAAVLDAYEGVSNVVDDLPYGKDQLIFELTPGGRALGLTPQDLGAQLNAAYAGRRVQIFNEDDAELEVRVLLPDGERDDLAALSRFPVRTPDGALVPLGNVATLSARRGIDTIRHHDTQLAIRIFADVDTEVNNSMSILDDLREVQLPPILERWNLEFGLSGKSANDEVILGTMGLGSMLTLVLIYLILAWVFSSYVWPLAIMTAIPFGLTGAIVGHWIMGLEIGAMSMLAFFALTGIVVNDSIVLVSFFKDELARGAGFRDALESAAVARFRAILLTSLTTIAGLLPLIYQPSTLAIYVVPIAVTLCFGLTLSTLLVLLVIPSLLLLFESARQRLAAVFERFQIQRYFQGQEP